MNAEGAVVFNTQDGWQNAKTSIIHALMSGMERYSQEQDGAVYTFSWVFPLESYTKGKIGINSTGRLSMQ